MSLRPTFSPSRFWAIVVKEFIQMRRDRVTFGMMIGRGNDDIRVLGEWFVDRIHIDRRAHHDRQIGHV